VYLSLLVENPPALEQFVKLCAASPWVANWLGNHPALLDELLHPEALSRNLDEDSLRQELRQRLARVPADDQDGFLNTLREFRHGHVLRIAALDLDGQLAAEEVSRRLSNVAGVCLGAALAQAHELMAGRFGVARCADGSEAEFAVIAYGKLGSAELGYASDLDLIFLYQDAAATGASDGQRSLSNDVYFARLGQRLLSILNTRTAAGILYETDMRLRPSGQSGALVTSLSGFERYQQEKAWTWEHQALVRARPVAGDTHLSDCFEAARQRLLAQPRDRQQLAGEVLGMRERMRAAHDRSTPDRFDLKHGRGGLVDIEFLGQYWVLRWASRHPELTARRGTLEVLAALAEAKLIQSAWQRTLSDAFRKFLATEHHLRLMERRPSVAANKLVAERSGVLVVWEAEFAFVAPQQPV
jgi:glutamate-ammonia-ligase adenylyltransferase